MYCNLLQCTHFADTSVLTEVDGEVSGFVSGYLIPERSDTLFVWQVAVSKSARGQGLGRHMIMEILRRPAHQHVKYIETSITPDNEASWALFRGLARILNAPIDSRLLFDEHTHFQGRHASESLVRIGPFSMKASKS